MRRRSFDKNGDRRQPLKPKPGHKTLVMPRTAKLDARRLKNGKVNFTYIETFDSVEVVVKTYRLFETLIERKLIPFSCRRVGRKGLELKGTVAQDEFADMMVGEFLCWSRIGTMSLSDVITSGVALAGRR